MINSAHRSSLKNPPHQLTALSLPIEPGLVHQWFPVSQQQFYISRLMGRVGLTRRRAECFVKLWAYLFLKQQLEGEVLDRPLTVLEPTEQFIPCTHREAAELFYSQQEKGSNRAAGMMIDRLTHLGLIEKRFDGHTICIRIRSVPELSISEAPESSVDLVSDSFNPRTDTIPIANLLARNFIWMDKDPSVVAPHKMSKILKAWAQQYPQGMRVLRRCDNLNAVGVCILCPIDSQSEANFFLPPVKSLYLTGSAEVDPFVIAKPNDLEVTAVFGRAWMIDTPFLTRTHICQSLRDCQQTLIKMQSDFPNLCDFYALTPHPLYEELLATIGFQRTAQSSQSSLYWAYQAVDRFVELDIEQAIAALKLDAFPGDH